MSLIGAAEVELPPCIHRKGIGDILAGIMIFIYGMLGFDLVALI